MPQLNDVVTLSFEFAPGEPVQLRPRDLARVVDAFESLCTKALSSFGEVQVTLHLVAPPQPGSIIFAFASTVVTTVDADRIKEVVEKSDLKRPDKKSRATLLSEYGSIASALLAIGAMVAGDQHHERSQSEGLAMFENGPLVRDYIDSLHYHYQRGEPYGVVKIACSASRAERVIICVPGSSPEVIYKRLPYGVAAREAREADLEDDYSDRD